MIGLQKPNNKLYLVISKIIFRQSPDANEHCPLTTMQVGSKSNAKEPRPESMEKKYIEL